MSPATLGFGFTRDRRVVVDDHIPAGSRGGGSLEKQWRLPNAIIYLFAMAGKLMSNFPPSEIMTVAGIAVSNLEGLLADPLILWTQGCRSSGCYRGVTVGRKGHLTRRSGSERSSWT